MDYTSLVADKSTSGSIKNWVNNSRVPADVILVEAEAWIYRRLRVREMLTRWTGTMTVGQESLTLPADYLQARTLWITGVERAQLKRALVEEVEARRAYDQNGALIRGKPHRFYADASTLQFEVAPDQAYPFRSVYYRQLPALGPSNTTNVLTAKFPTLLRFACMAMANSFMKDDGEKTYWEAKAAAELGEIKVESDLEMQNLDARMELV
jgi:hypothetical protein